jgi:hypothetical protein
VCLRKSVSFNSSSPIAELELKRNLQVALAAVASQKHGIDRLLPLKKKNLAGPPCLPPLMQLVLHLLKFKIVSARFGIPTCPLGEQPEIRVNGALQSILAMVRSRDRTSQNP